MCFNLLQQVTQALKLVVERNPFLSTKPAPHARTTEIPAANKRQCRADEALCSEPYRAAIRLFVTDVNFGGSRPRFDNEHKEIEGGSLRSRHGCEPVELLATASERATLPLRNRSQWAYRRQDTTGRIAAKSNS